MKYHVWLEKWLTCYVGPYVKERTYQKYENQIRLHILPALGEWELEELSAERLQRFVVSLMKKGMAANSINGVITIVKTSLKSAVSLDMVVKQYADCIQRPKVKEKKVECFSKTEQRKIEEYVLKKMPNKPKLFGIILCLYTGLRIGELLALTWADIDFSQRSMSVTKSCRDVWTDGKYNKAIDTPKTKSSERRIPLPKQLIKHLKDLKKISCSDYVIGGQRACGASIRSYQKSFEGILKKLKIEHKSFHSLRHTFATRAIECGMDIKTLSEILGHKNPTVTLTRYTHSMLEHKKEMMNKVGNLLNHPKKDIE